MADDVDIYFILEGIYTGATNTDFVIDINNLSSCLNKIKHIDREEALLNTGKLINQ